MHQTHSRACDLSKKKASTFIARRLISLRRQASDHFTFLRCLAGADTAACPLPASTSAIIMDTPTDSSGFLRRFPVDVFLAWFSSWADDVCMSVPDGCYEQKHKWLTNIVAHCFLGTYQTSERRKQSERFCNSWQTTDDGKLRVTLCDDESVWSREGSFGVESRLNATSALFASITIHRDICSPKYMYHILRYTWITTCGTEPELNLSPGKAYKSGRSRVDKSIQVQVGASAEV